MMFIFNKSFAFFFLQIVLTVQNVCCQDGPVVETSYGPVRGSTILVNPYDVSVNSFHAIYYARAPVGDLRFAPPEPPEPWTDVRDATELGPSCVQNAGGLFLLTHPQWDYFSEDCLHVDVYAPTDTSNAPFPVFVWFHGGGYQSGGNIQYPGHYLAAKDTIVVVVNYRLGNLGFMYTGDSAAPGNAGMLDQVLALQWVQDNIANFGGNPDLVTIFGQSAGGSSAGLHLVSPLSAGLFSGAILESGTELAVWAVNPPVTEPENYAVDVATQLGCPTDDTTAMIECLRLVDAEELYLTRFNCTPGSPCLGMAPVVDGPDGFLPDTPWNLLDREEINRVPEIVMYTAQDAAVGLLGLIAVPSVNISDGLSREEFEMIVSAGVDYFLPALPGNESLKEDIEEAVNFMYSPWPYIDDGDLNRDNMGYLLTDGAFGATADAQAKAHSFTDIVYKIVFAYRSDGFRIAIPDWTGVFHAMDLPYVFGLAYMELNPDIRNDSGIYFDAIRYNDFDREYFEFMGDMWVNFARTRNPTPTPVQPPADWPPVTWEPLTMDAANYLWVDNEVAEMRKDYRQIEYTFWTEYLRCMIFGDFPHVPGMTSCESAYVPPSSRPSSSDMRRTSQLPQDQSDAFRFSDLLKQSAELFYENGIESQYTDDTVA